MLNSGLAVTSKAVRPLLSQYRLVKAGLFLTLSEVMRLLLQDNEVNSWLFVTSKVVRSLLWQYSTAKAGL